MQLLHMLPDHTLWISPAGICGIPLQQGLFRQIQHNGNAVNMLFPGKGQNPFPGRLLHIGGIDYSGFHPAQPLLCCIIQ